MLYSGACHCGAVNIVLNSTIKAETAQVRACACSFCRKHGARTLTDPNGRLQISCEELQIERYRFALRTADYLICKTCGLYITAVAETDLGLRGTLNVNLLNLGTAFQQTPPLVNYDGETRQGRLSRRRQNWTPTEIVKARP